MHAAQLGRSGKAVATRHVCDGVHSGASHLTMNDSPLKRIEFRPLNVRNVRGKSRLIVPG
jgi:hypothetical protein